VRCGSSHHRAGEIAKLERLRSLGLPNDVLINISAVWRNPTRASRKIAETTVAATQAAKSG
jgi:hypothetical protein